MGAGAIIVVGTAVLVGGPDRDGAAVATESSATGSSTVTTSRTGTTGSTSGTTLVDSGVVGDSPATSAPEETVPPSTTLTTTTAVETTTTGVEPPCRNSTESSCGPFFYDWETNTPATVTIIAEPAVARVGETVIFTVEIVDPDGTTLSGFGAIQYSPDVTFTTSRDGEPPGYGPWDPPEPRHQIGTYEWTYDTAGDYVVRYETDDAGLGCPGESCPRAAGEIILTVQP